MFSIPAGLHSYRSTFFLLFPAHLQRNVFLGVRQSWPTMDEWMHLVSPCFFNCFINMAHYATEFAEKLKVGADVVACVLVQILWVQRPEQQSLTLLCYVSH